MFRPLANQLANPVDSASFVAFRVGFGLLATFAAVRFVALGWIEELLLKPTFRFSWVSGLPEPTSASMYGLFAVQALAGVFIAMGWRVRPALVCWLLSFGYVEALDKTLYLNHYVLFTLVGLCLLVAPVQQVSLRQGRVPTWVLWTLRLQFGSVYVWAGLCKLNADWMFRAEPLQTWLQARADLPWIGPLLANDSTAFAMSWGGAVYDLSVPFLLLWARTRPLAVVLVIGFHVIVGSLFNIGIFPALMMLGATVFLAPDWPRRWLGGAARVGRSWGPLPLGATVAWVGIMAFILLFPARFVLSGTDVNWSERGYRFSWRVLLNEKTGLVDYRVVDRASGRTWRVLPGRELTLLQHKQMRTQPDMIRDYAHHLQQTYEHREVDVAVYVDAFASLNGRPSQRLIRPDVDLTQPLGHLEAQHWIVALEP